MHEALHRVGFVHDSNPGTEAGVSKTVSETGDDIDHNDDGIWRM